jgi:hypothetical protein
LYCIVKITEKQRRSKIFKFYYLDCVKHFIFVVVTERSFYRAVEGGGDVGDVVRGRRRRRRRRRKKRRKKRRRM